jgi:hypothetical protein
VFGFLHYIRPIVSTILNTSGSAPGEALMEYVDAKKCLNVSHGSATHYNKIGNLRIT